MNPSATRGLICWCTWLGVLALLPYETVEAGNSIFAGEFTGRELRRIPPRIDFCETRSARAYQVVEDFTVETTGSYSVVQANYGAGIRVRAMIYEAPVTGGSSIRVPSDVDGRLPLQQGRFYDLVVEQVHCSPQRGFWTMVFNGPGEVIAPAQQAIADDFMEGAFVSSDPVLQNYGCGESVPHYHSSGAVTAQETGDYFIGTTNDSDRLPVCVLVYTDDFDPESPQRNRIAQFWHSGPAAVRLEKNKTYHFVVVAGGDLAQFNGEYFYVLAEQQPFRINPALSGSWYNADMPGQGFFIDVMNQRDQLFIGWFTFEVPGGPSTTSADFGASDQRWLTAFGGVNSERTGTEELIIERTQGGVFDEGQPEVEQTADGTLKVSFESCDAGILEYRIERLDLEGEIAIQRVSSARSNQCRDAYRGPGVPACIGCSTD